MPNGDGTQPLETPAGQGPQGPGIAQLQQFIKMMQAQQQQRQPGQVFPGMPGASLAAPTLPGQPPVGGQPPVPGAMPGGGNVAQRGLPTPPAPQRPRRDTALLSISKNRAPQTALFHA